MPTLYHGANGDFYKFDNLDTNYLTQHNTDLVTIFDHTHTNNPINGTTAIQAGTITAASITDATITSAKLAAQLSFSTLSNNAYLKWRNAANNADLDVIRVNTSDKIEFEKAIDKIRLSNNITLKGTTTGGADHNIWKVNASDQWEFLNTAYSQTVLAKTDSTYDVGSASLAYALGYFDNLRVTDYSSSVNFYAATTWTPGVIGGTSAGSPTYNSRDGYYVKVGDLVYISFYIDLSAHTGTGVAIITGLPFTSNANIARQMITLGWSNYNLDNGNASYAGEIYNSETQIRLTNYADAGASTGWTIDAANILYGSGIYRI